MHCLKKINTTVSISIEWQYQIPSRSDVPVTTNCFVMAVGLEAFSKKVFSLNICVIEDGTKELRDSETQKLAEVKVDNNEVTLDTIKDGVLVP